jgi:glycerophosphoryl diester phosphodiesterase
LNTRRDGPWPDGPNVMASVEGIADSIRVPRAVVAHRGDSGHRPENTQVAFQAAVDMGVECIELDVHLSRDGALIIIHDGSVDRTSDSQGKVAELTLEQIKAMDAGRWFGEAFAGERFLTLEEALDVIAAPVRLNVHIKAYTETRDVVTAATVKCLRERELLDRAYLASDEETLAVARACCAGIEVCNLSVQPPQDYVARSAGIGCRILQPGHAMTTPELVAAAHAHEMQVFPFFADEEDEMRRLINCGVDGMLTNEPARLQALLA